MIETTIHHLTATTLLGLTFLTQALALLPASGGTNLGRRAVWHVPTPTAFIRTWYLQSRIVDAEFETVPEDTDDRRTSNRAKADDAPTIPESLLDLSLSSDTEIGNLRVPFCDGENCIDVKLSFMTELDGTQYAIGIPYDCAAAIALERKDGVVENLSPDCEENIEFMELMAQQLKETVGDDLNLVRSPRVLTIAGPLDKYTKNWKEEVLPKSVDTETLLNQDDEDIQSFLDFMKEELGEEEFTKTMNEEHTFDDETLELFNIPGFGGEEDGIADFLKKEFEDIATSSDDDEYADRQNGMMENLVGTGDLTHDGVGLKLVGYNMADGKQYSLVQLLKPVVLVAKHVAPNYRKADGETDGTADGQQNQRASLSNPPSFDLLSPPELRLVSPRLEEMCRADLAKLGWNFDERKEQLTG